LIALVKQSPDSAPVQSYIHAAVALAKRLRERAPGDVMTFFVDLDRDLKRLGNKRFVTEIAKLSLHAADLYHQTTSQTANRQVLQDIRDARARTMICGLSWQYQRTGQLDVADAKAGEALALSPSAATIAFGVKCRGRLRRLQAQERFRTAAEKATLLQDSEDLLLEAIDRFAKLSDFPDANLEMGDCHSLLGRTLLVRGDLRRAKVHAAKADDLLVGYEQKKAMLDLRLLRADILRTENNLAGARQEYESLLSFPFTNDAEQNEIKARLHEALAATLIRLNRREDGLKHYQTAINIYTALDETGRAERVTVTMRANDGMPKGLATISDEYPAHLILHALETATSRAARDMRRSNVDDWSSDQWREHLEKVKPQIAISRGEPDW
jgi:tetratricopeptide (TPR) repeat protein